MNMSKQEWSSVPLCEIAEIERTAVSPENIKSGTSYVGLENITSSGQFVGVAEVANGGIASTKFAFTNKHILYGKLRPYLTKIARPDFCGVCSTDILPILPGPNVDRGFLQHYLRQPRIVDYASSRTSGANLPRLSPKALAEFAIPLPPLPEQKRIADILDKADAIRRKRREAIQLTSSIATSLFGHRFGDPVANSKGWPIVSMGSLFLIPPNYGTMIVASESGGKWLNLRVANIQGGVLDLSDKKYVNLPDNTVERHEVRKGDLLLARAIGSQEHLGKCFVADPGSDCWAFDSHLMRVRFDVRKAEPRYVHAFLCSPGGRHEFLRNSRRSAVQFNINTKEMARLSIPLPPLAVQRMFVRDLERLDLVIQRQHDSAASQDALFHSLVQRAFAGEL